MSRKSGTAVLKRITQLSPLVMIGICIIIYMKFFRGVTIAQILEFTPKNLWLAAIFMVGMFAMKSLSVVFPMLILIAATGSIFPNYFAALAVNSLGVLAMITIPYLIGRYAEREFVEGLINKNPKSDKLREIQSENELFIAYFTRVINLLPCDLVSMFLGSMGFAPWKYLLGSFLGIFPGVITTTLMGANADDPKSPKFWAAVIVEVVFAVSSSAAYFVYKRRKAN